ncbi:restriction endonuclease subunit S [Flavobacteriales bacterium]|nr:restriction endonuclease subunit S [Flavobacteriales bacterium]
MDSALMVNKVLNLDKTSWKLTKVGDLAKDISKRVDNPGESEYDRFVGLGNFVSGDVKIKTWETTENLESSAKAFKAGDILFARRNAYLRRASLVDFDGCCSGDAFVLRENHDKIVPGFLAFLMNSNALWDYANSNAAGTMSKRVKWRDLAEYKFLLPPKDQQAQLAKLLWAMDEVIEKERKSANQILVNKRVLLDELCKVEIVTPKRLSDFIEIRNGYAFKGKNIVNEEADRILMTPGNFKIGGGFSFDKMKYYNSDDVKPEFIFNTGDMVITMTDLSKDGDTLGYPAIIPEVNGKTILHNQRLGKVLFKNDELEFKFLYYLLQTPKYRKHILNAATKTTVRHTYSKRITGYKFNFLNLSEQAIWVSRFSSLDNTHSEFKSKITASRNLQKSLINQIF